MLVDPHRTPATQAPTAPDGAAHAVHFYSDADGLAQRLADFVAGGLLARENCIVIARPSHRAGLERRLRAADVDVCPSQLVVLDAAATLQGFMRSGRPDPELFDATVGTLIRSAARSAPGVRAYGEMVALLWACGNAVAALQLEDLWGSLLAQVRFSLLCAYPTSELDAHPVADDAVEQVCARHTAVAWA